MMTYAGPDAWKGNQQDGQIPDYGSSLCFLCDRLGGGTEVV